jgi:hypothetical protein
MSGGGGGGYRGYDDSTNCLTLIIRTHIASPDPAILVQLQVGDMLDVALIPPSGPVQLLTRAGVVVGAVLPVDVIKLIQCISEGHAYEAKILSISGGNCQVLIQHV